MSPPGRRRGDTGVIREHPCLHRGKTCGSFACVYVMPRSRIHGSPRRFYYGLNLTDDPGNANFRSPIRMHYIRMTKYYDA